MLWPPSTPTVTWRYESKLRGSGLWQCGHQDWLQLRTGRLWSSASYTTSAAGAFTWLSGSGE